MSIEKLISDYKKALEETENLKKKVVNALDQEITNAPIPGVTPISNTSGVRTVSVRSSALAGGIWTPEYYISESQAKLVTERISGIVAPDALITALEDMINTRKVVLKYTTHFLNDTTIAILQKVVDEIKNDKDGKGE